MEAHIVPPSFAAPSSTMGTSIRVISGKPPAKGHYLKLSSCTHGKLVYISISITDFMENSRKWISLLMQHWALTDLGFTESIFTTETTIQQRVRLGMEESAHNLQLT